MELVGAVGDGKSDLGPQWSTSMNILQKLGHAARDLIAARASDQGQIVFPQMPFWSWPRSTLVQTSKYPAITCCGSSPGSLRQSTAPARGTTTTVAAD